MSLATIVLPLPAVIRSGAVAHVIAADDQHQGVEPMLQDAGQRPHEYVVTPVRLQVAVDEGDDLVALGQVQLPV